MYKCNHIKGTTKILAFILSLIIALGSLVFILGICFEASAGVIYPYIYQDGALISIASPYNGTDVYYKINTDGNWQKYEHPFSIPAYQESKIYAKTANNPLSITKTFNSQGDQIGEYTETQIDATLTYKSIKFDFLRKYSSSSNTWFFSVNSYMEALGSPNENTNVKKVILPDATEMYFNNGYNSLNNLRLNFENNEYSLQIETIKYIFDGKWLKSIENNNGDKINIIRSENQIIVQDDKGRKYILKLDDANNIISITDPLGGIIEYKYNSDNLLLYVNDASGTKVNTYSYKNQKLATTNDKSIYYTGDRISKICYIDGYFENYSYNNTDKSMSITTASDENYSILYNDAYIPLSITVNDVTTYFSYDSKFRKVHESIGEKIASYAYDENNNILKIEITDTKENTVLQTFKYDYDTNNRLIREFDSNNYTYYDYDSDGNLIVCAELKDKDNSKEIPAIYSENENSFNITAKYTYENGFCTKAEYCQDSAYELYSYDDYGNLELIESVDNANQEEIKSQMMYAYDDLGNIIATLYYQYYQIPTYTQYVYDKAGRLLREQTNGLTTTRYVYDDKGRLIQRIDPQDYESSLDGLPDNNTYSNENVGQRYIYNQANQLIREINRYGLETEYTYSSIGTLYQKHFDIYDYYYYNNGNLKEVTINGNTIIKYDYDVADSKIENDTGQPINRITYSNGYVEEQKTDALGNVIEKYKDGQLSYIYDNNYQTDYLSHRKTQTTITNNSFEFNQQTLNTNQIFSYNMAINDSQYTIDESHFGQNYQEIVQQNSITYKTPTNLYNYTLEETDAWAKMCLHVNDNIVLSSEIGYDTDGTAFNKTYNTHNISYQNQCDDFGNIISDERNQYTYNEFGELISVTGENVSTYTYDERGNMLSKIAQGEEINFQYNNPQWPDQLTAVNNVTLSYDSVGNLTSYGNTQFTWNYGKLLTSVKNGENLYAYQYDNNGIRTSKTINGVVTEFNVLNGIVLAQSDGVNTIYFQYNLGAPIGFELNGIQYFYITNLNGDVTGITDIEGNLIAQYVYDEWGSILDIITAEDNNAHQQFIAEINPLRFRGYYYDSETGLYYLQTRYYDPDICRFISADNFDYVESESRIGINAYAYCINNPIMYIDPNGNYIKTNDIPPASSGYVPPKGGPKKVPIPGRKDGSKGWVDKNGNVWYPDKLHNGSDSEHWDVVDKNGKNHRNVYPDGRQDHDSSSKISLDNLLNSILDLFIPTNDVVTIICILIPIILFLFFLLIVGLPILLPIFI